jgi:prolipoprotein diacylglyceryl transferase
MTYLTSVQTLDKLVVGVAIGATSIRLGNLMNSEIYGGPTTLPWGFNFIRNTEWHKPLNMGGSGELPCHPTQIYEALTYFCIFLIGLFLFYKTPAKTKSGFILGVSLIGIFLSRFIVEFIKNTQVYYEQAMVLNMGQLLSLPFVVWGVWLVWSAVTRKGGPIDEKAIK